MTEQEQREFVERLTAAVQPVAEAFQKLGAAAIEAAMAFVIISDLLAQLDLPDEFDHIRRRGRWPWREFARMPLTEAARADLLWLYYNAPPSLMFRSGD